MGIIENALGALPASHAKLWVAARPAIRRLVTRRVAGGANPTSLLVVIATPLTDVGDVILDDAMLEPGGDILVAVLDGLTRRMLLLRLGIQRVDDVPDGHVLVITAPGDDAPGLSVARLVDTRTLS